ncbi:hypothetical protein V3391_00940 [Luteimonas sp. SMYT11W]|uniref:Uncharacterized protein n=1 Tax=Luteimonas flava TaxID=3115822 RepID=A0ABU7WC67_9GAMM
MSLFLGLLELPSKIVSFASNYSEAKEASLNALTEYERFTGRYSSDPNAWIARNVMQESSPPTDEGDLQLSIQYLGGGRYSGEIHSIHMIEHLPVPWSRILVDGKVGVRGGFEGVVLDVVENQHRAYASFKLRVEDERKGTLRLIPNQQPDGVFPGEVVLWPTEFKMAEGERGREFYRALRRLNTETRGEPDSMTAQPQ